MIASIIVNNIVDKSIDQTKQNNDGTTRQTEVKMKDFDMAPSRTD